MDQRTPDNIPRESRIFQFVAIQPLQLMRRLLKSYQCYPINLIIDLEDSLWQPTDAIVTRKRKAVAREILQTMLQNNPGLLSQGIGIRINNRKDHEYSRDLELLANLKPDFKLDYVLLPKLESPGEIEGYYEDFRKLEIVIDEYIPIIETQRGRKMLPQIISTCSQYSIKRVLYGHFDFSLDCGVWPVKQQDTFEFWNDLMPLIHCIEEGGLTYVHTAYPKLQDSPRFTELLARLRLVCRSDYGIISLNLTQSKTALDFFNHLYPSVQPLVLTQQEAFSNRELVQQAQQLVDSYLKKSRNTHSFSLNGAQGLFISPHEYLLALNFLDKIKTDRN